jgi:ribosomal protein L16 Arg81 hydroxylase
MKIELGISAEDFHKNYFGVQPLLVRGACTPAAFSWRDANSIFNRCNVLAEDFKLSHDGIVPKSRYVESYVDIGDVRHRLIKPVVYDYLRDGATLVANKVKGEPVIESFARQIGRFTGQQVVSSVYAAFGTRDSFRAHWDTRDVFAIQLIGRKRWLVYEPSLPYPVFTQQSKDYEHTYPCPEQPCMDFVLEAGDVFYLPRGWWHNPLPLGEATFHLSLGTFPPLAMNYLAWAVEQSRSFVELRKAVSDWNQSRETIAAVAGHIADFLCNSDNYRQFQDEHLAAARLDSSLALDSLGRPGDAGVPDDQRVQVCAISLHGLDAHYLITNGTKVKLDGVSHAIIRTIAHAPGIAVGELVARHPDIAPSKLRALVTELCRQDVLEPVF